MSTNEALTFETHDRLGFHAFAQDLEAYIETESLFVSGSLVVSLNAPFGSGKSTFIQMWQSSLAQRRKSDQSIPIPIILNTWESDHSRDPLLAIISGLSRELIKYEIPNEKIDKIREATKTIAWFGLSLANSFVSNTTGIDAFAAGETAEKKKSEYNDSHKRTDLLASFEQRADALRYLRYLLEELFQPQKSRAIIMVDELDRCRPDYAVEFLEAIKHVFTSKGVTFVLAIDKNQLRSSVKVLYGHDLNFEEYYRKFAHRNIALPSISEKNATDLIRHFWNEVVLHSELRPKSRSYALYNDTSSANLKEVALSLKLSPRQINEMLRIYGHVMTLKKDKDGDLFWGFSVAAALMAALAVSSREIYEDIGNQRASFIDLRSKLFDLFKDKGHGEWWLALLGNGRAFSIASHDEILRQAKEVGLLAKIQDGNSLRQTFSEYSQAWGHWNGELPFKHVYEIIEKLRRFENASAT